MTEPSDENDEFLSTNIPTTVIGDVFKTSTDALDDEDPMDNLFLNTETPEEDNEFLSSVPPQDSTKSIGPFDSLILLKIFNKIH